ncbi:MAG TPA: hypothetical protein VJS92_17855 [Candidatus Polarisedimenticolaceae bacterium]|nr:hypothetical protein [Candidatus Polarisedimenticolaceae bacterium]
MALEREPRRLGDAFREVMSELPRLDARELARPLVVRQTVSAAGPPVDVGTTLGRELAFAASHAIHHLAICRLLAAQHGVVVPEELTLAPSTAAHRRALGAGD